MNIVRRLKVPTGDIVVVEGEKGLLEFVSLGDYGQKHNLKCDALGLGENLGRVVHRNMLPLTEKWVITISTQYGCSMGCHFCDVPKVGPGKNATFRDLTRQIITGLKLHPEIETSKRLNVHFARMGEPTFNPDVLDCARWLKDHIDPEYNVHPVVSTMMPRNNPWLKTFIHNWMRIKNRLYHGNAGLQLSINSTSHVERTNMFNGNACTLEEIAMMMRGIVPVGRKITLNFAVAGYDIDPAKLLFYFDPEDYIIKLTPMHQTERATHHGLATPGDAETIAPYRGIEESLKAAGYDVLVFIASHEEDAGLITCGNAILSGSLPTVDYTEIKETQVEATA